MCGTVQWGDVPGWIEALATVVAAVAAIAAFRYARRAFRLEQNRDRDREEERLKTLRASIERQRRAQAVKVSSWVELSTFERDLIFGPLGQRQVRVRNASDLPVWSVVALVGKVGEDDFTEVGSRTVLPPGEDVTFVFGPNTDSSDDPEGLVRCIVVFTDSAGARWHRNEDGVLDGGGF